MQAATSADLQLLRDPSLVQAIGSPVRNISQTASNVSVRNATQDLKGLRSLPERYVSLPFLQDLEAYDVI